MVMPLLSSLSMLSVLDVDDVDDDNDNCVCFCCCCCEGLMWLIGRVTTVKATTEDGQRMSTVTLQTNTNRPTTATAAAAMIEIVMTGDDDRD